MLSASEKMIVALIGYGIINRGQATLLREDVEKGVPLRRSCIEHGYTSQETYATIFSFLTHRPIVDLSRSPIDLSARDSIPHELAKKYNVVPLRVENNYLVVVMNDPTNTEMLEEISRVAGQRIKPIISLRDDLDEYIQRLYQKSA